MIDPAAVPTLKPGVKFRFDRSREAWVLLAPERLFMPDEIAVEVLKLVDGERTAAAIVDALTAAFEAPREVIEADVLAMLDDLRGKGALAA
jgi:pyrroloquinoline quinone biosynthesis protein D